MYGDITVWMVGVVFNGQRTVWMVGAVYMGLYRLDWYIPFGWARAVCRDTPRRVSTDTVHANVYGAYGHMHCIAFHYIRRIPLYVMNPIIYSAAKHIGYKKRIRDIPPYCGIPFISEYHLNRLDAICTGITFV